MSAPAEMPCSCGKGHLVDIWYTNDPREVPTRSCSATVAGYKARWGVPQGSKIKAARCEIEKRRDT